MNWTLIAIAVLASATVLIAIDIICNTVFHIAVAKAAEKIKELDDETKSNL